MKEDVKNLAANIAPQCVADMLEYLIEVEEVGILDGRPYWKTTGEDLIKDPSECEPVAAAPDQIELGKLAAFGKSVWDWIKANPDFCGDEFSETFLPMAEEAGLCRKEPYDPEKHGEIEYGEVGFDIWTWD